MDGISSACSYIYIYIYGYTSINEFHPNGRLGDVWNKSASIPRECHYVGMHVRRSLTRFSTAKPTPYAI